MRPDAQPDGGTVSAAPVIVTRVVNADERPFNVRIVRAGDCYGRDNRLEHDSTEPLVEFWDATDEHDPHKHKHDPRYTLGLGLFAGRHGLIALTGTDGFSRDHRCWGSPGLDLCDYKPEWKVTTENVMDAIAAAEAAALYQVDADIAKTARCELCVAGHRRVSGVHWVQHSHEPCARVSVVYDDAPGRKKERWLAYVDGGPLRKQNGDPRRYASADAAHKAALDAAPKLGSDRDRPRPPPRAGTTTALVHEIIDLPRHFPWLTTSDIVKIAAERGTPVKSSTVTVALHHLQYDDVVDVDRTRRPFRYRRGNRKVAPSGPEPKLSAEMLRVLREIKISSQWSICGALGTRQALIRRGLVRRIKDDQGRIGYEISTEGTKLLEKEVHAVSDLEPSATGADPSAPASGARRSASGSTRIGRSHDVDHDAVKLIRRLLDTLEGANAAGPS